MAKNFYYSSLAKLRNALITRSRNLGIPLQKVEEFANEGIKLVDVDPSPDYFLGGEKEAIESLMINLDIFEKSPIPQTIEMFYQLNVFGNKMYMQNAEEALEAYPTLLKHYEDVLEELRKHAKDFQDTYADACKNKEKVEADGALLGDLFLKLSNLEFDRKAIDEKLAEATMAMASCVREAKGETYKALSAQLCYLVVIHGLKAIEKKNFPGDIANNPIVQRLREVQEETLAIGKKVDLILKTPIDFLEI